MSLFRKLVLMFMPILLAMSVGCKEISSGIAPGSAPGNPERIMFMAQPNTTSVGAYMQIKVAIVDSEDLICYNVSGVVTLAIATNPGGGTLSGNTTVATQAGVATFVVMVRELGVVDMLKSSVIMILSAFIVGGLLNLILGVAT